VAQPDAGGPWSRFYTRVSTDHRLEQDFNSLDAQHEAAPAYIRSQAHARWTLIRSPYDDGGYSGGSTERPALQRLLAEVRGGKSTSLSSTRSIGSPDHWLTSPSSWNCSMPTRRRSYRSPSSSIPPPLWADLTLNLLLSFAQFEREVTSERIRNKIALSKPRSLGRRHGSARIRGQRPQDCRA
jgi:site-specific DNA recombinase